MKSLKSLRLSAGETQAQIAALLGITRAAYTNIENGKREPDFEILNKLADYYGVTTDFLFGREPLVKPPFVFPNHSLCIPLFDSGSAGTPAKEFADWKPIGEIPFSDSGAKKGELFAWKVCSAAMEPRILYGDILIVRKQQEISQNGLFLFSVDRCEPNIMQIQKTPDGLLLFSSNPANPPSFLSVRSPSYQTFRVYGKGILLQAELQ